MKARRQRFVQTGRDEYTDRLTGRKHQGDLRLRPLLKGFYLPKAKS